MYAAMHECRPRDNLEKSVLRFYHMGALELKSGHQVGGKCLHILVRTEKIKLMNEG